MNRQELSGVNRGKCTGDTEYAYATYPDISDRTSLLLFCVQFFGDMPQRGWPYCH